MMASYADLARGFRLDDPDVLIAWGSPANDVLKAFVAKGISEPRQVTPLYYTARCQVLGGLQCQVGFYFEATVDSQSLDHIELLDNGARDVDASYRVFQEKLVQHFGSPRVQQPGTLSASMPYCEWRVGSVRILHYVIDRFGPEERVSIQRRVPALGLSPIGIAALLASLAVLMLLWWLKWC